VYGALAADPPWPYPDAVEPITIPGDKEWLSVADICEYLGVTPFVVTRVLRSGELPGVKIGREWRVARLDFEDWLNAQRFEARSRALDRD
jgi:excisionase family DNA binding protein